MSIIKDAYRRFSTERFPLPSEEQLADLERRIGCTFPEDYRQFILEFNGGCFCEPEIEPTSEGCPLDGLTFLHGIGASDPAAELGEVVGLELFDDNDPPQIVPIGVTAMAGLIILIVHEEECGAILLKQAYADFHFLADGIEEFFSLLREPPDPEEE